MIEKYLERAKQIAEAATPHWSIQEPWNYSTLISKQWETKPRDILYASEVGSSFLETYWKLNGVAPTNAISESGRRKMEAGNLYEAIVVWTLRKVGILKETQGKIRLTDDPDLLPVYGRFDILAGFEGSWDEKVEELEFYFKKMESEGFDFPFFNIVKSKSIETLKYLKEKYPDGLETKLYEVKSINSIAFWRGDKMISDPYEHHKRQLMFYILHNEYGVKNGSFLYIDRDTMSISELPCRIDMDIVKGMYEWLEKMTYYYRNKIEPERPPIVIFDKKVDKYCLNWIVLRSDYKDKFFEGIDQVKLAMDIKKMNKEHKEKSRMKKASINEEFYGMKKYQKAIALLDKSMDAQDVMKATGVPLHALLHYIEDLQNEDGKN